MNRETSIRFLDEHPDFLWDVIIIGGGATGLGVALEATLRGYSTLLLEQADFTKGTSSRSTKLVHGGVRYLAQGNLKLVLEALRERGILLRNAPHLTYNQSFIVPAYSWFKSLFYATGLKLYDLLSGRLTLGKSALISSKSVIEKLPGLKKAGLSAGILYHDGQFDDARLGINLAQSSAEQGAHVLNYVKVTGLTKDINGKINGIKATDLETTKVYLLKAKAVVNATGVFVDDILKMDKANASPMVRTSQGAHVVLDKSFLPGRHALMIPKTSDGRVLFAIPWHGKVVVGTTDTLTEQTELEPRALKEEVDFILQTFGEYVSTKPGYKDVLSVFSGLRPLAKAQSGQSTKEISRSHKLIVSESGLITITGGKWTTYRQMAQETVDLAAKQSLLPYSACITSTFQIHGYTLSLQSTFKWLEVYGSDANEIIQLMTDETELASKLHPEYAFTRAEVVWAVRREMARTIEDVLARRIRILFLDARAALQMAPDVAWLMAKEMHKDDSWVQKQIQHFTQLAKGYMLDENGNTIT